jgi:uncharacterized protein
MHVPVHHQTCHVVPDTDRAARLMRLCIIIIVLYGLLSTQATAASFDCKKAASWMEKTICADEVLSQFDDQLAKSYHDALTSLSPEGQKETKQYQKQWVKEISPYCKDRLKAKRDDNATQCFKDVYKKRIKQLQQNLIKYPDRIFRNVHVSQSEIKKTCGFIARDLIYPQIENPRDENEKSFNYLISKKAISNLGNPTCSATDDTDCESDCVDVDAKFTINFNSKRLISYQRETYWYGHGAAHGYTSIESSHWLLGDKRELQAADLFDNKTDWRKKLTVLVFQKLKEKEVAEKIAYEIKRASLTEEVCSPKQWVLSQDGLGIQFGEYDLGSRAAPLVTIDWKALDPYLSKNGHSLISAGQAEQVSSATTNNSTIKKITTTVKAVAALPRTGQTTCYNNAGKVIACKNTGQDGELQKGVAWPNPRFKDNGDQTVTDNLTGLIWMKDGNAPGPAICQPGKKKTWQQALDYAACLNTNNYLGHNDWRLPNTNELRSLANYGQVNNAAWLNTQGFKNVLPSEYWSSTTPASSAGDAWFVGMAKKHNSHVDLDSNSGYLAYNNKNNNYYYAWPLRSEKTGAISISKTGQKSCYSTSGKIITCKNTGQDGELQKGVAWPDPRFTDNDDQTITDNLTGLIWTKDANSPGPGVCRPAEAKNWQQAFNYVACLNTNNYLGYNDWRLPNINELASLVHAGQAYIADLLSAQGFIISDLAGYNSSTSGAKRTTRYWRVGEFGDVDDDVSDKDVDDVHFWPVRGGK